jgi:hypothetical protein
MALATSFSPFAAAAEDQAHASGEAAENAALPASPDETPVDQTAKQPVGASRWTISIEAIGLDRAGGVNRTLVERVPGDVPFIATATAAGGAALNSNQLQPGFSAGPKVDLIYHGVAGFDVELAYFNIFNRSISKSIGPDSPPDWLVMKSPGTFWQTQDYPNQAMAWKVASALYGAEANARFNLSDTVTLLAGVRWLRLDDSLVGTLPPADLTAPTWKSNLLTTISQITPGGPAGNYPPFWTTNTTNNLYGAQIGVAGTILRSGPWSLAGLLKLGLFDNDAEQSTGVSLEKVVHPSTARTNHASFVGEAGLQVKYRIFDGLTLQAGYEALWLAGVALAPGQIQETNTVGTNVRALGVNCGSAVLFNGITTGLEYSF